MTLSRRTDTVSASSRLGAVNPYRESVQCQRLRSGKRISGFETVVSTLKHHKFGTIVRYVAEQVNEDEDRSNKKAKDARKASLKTLNAPVDQDFIEVSLYSLGGPPGLDGAVLVSVASQSHGWRHPEVLHLCIREEVQRKVRSQVGESTGSHTFIERDYEGERSPRHRLRVVSLGVGSSHLKDEHHPFSVPSQNPLYQPRYCS